ncbi:hypothetical protein KBD75_01845 [Candidatus Woesebacteria bacterium]|nr:hypothetical protein [Candidatus Woesebacteria bacterium]
MSGKKILEQDIDYRLDHYGLTALTENGKVALEAAMSQPVYPFTLMVYETANRVTFNNRNVPTAEAERILHQAALKT